MYGKKRKQKNEQPILDRSKARSRDGGMPKKTKQTKGKEANTGQKIRYSKLCKMQILCNWGNGNLSRETAFAMPVPFLLAFCNIPYTLRILFTEQPARYELQFRFLHLQRTGLLVCLYIFNFRFNFTFLFL